MQEIILRQREIGKYVVKFINAEYEKYKVGTHYWAYNVEVFDKERGRTTWRSYHEDKKAAQRSYYYFCSKAKKAA